MPWRLALILAAVLALGLGGRMLMWTTHQDQGADSIGGPFTLVRHDGTTVTDADYRGQWMLVYFGYTHCPEICPMSLQTVSNALDRLEPAVRERLVPLFITVDWKRDTPERMAEYVDHFHPAIQGLTGSRKQVEAAARAYNVLYGPGQEEDIDHTAVVFLMDPQGAFVRHFTYGTEAPAMARGLRRTLTANDAGAG